MKNPGESRENKIEPASFEISPEILSDLTYRATNQPLEAGHFSVGNIKYGLSLAESKTETGEINGEPAEYFAHPNEWEIYIWEDLPEKIQRVLLFHEMTEIYLVVNLKKGVTFAHNATLSYEKDFKTGLLDEEEEKIIQKLRSK